MPDTTDLIRCARELAKLADYAEKHTDLPWSAVNESGYSGPYCIRDAERDLIASDVYTCWDLIAAAPEMARILGQLADELERLRNENARLRGSTFYECPDCGATCIGKD